MKHSFLDNMPLDEARTKYLALVKERGFKYKTEIIPSALSFGRVTSGAVYAKILRMRFF